ncbi:uncharacterized protein LOC125609943 [Brassica napus]|uniref:uncharacterized protein LOC125609943 n=1 Tax=Brassica napus TaxID=3708 RepID=UPI002078D2C1|nr:uncharacterized protein LOC125609943 [Brassica napus]
MSMFCLCACVLVLEEERSKQGETRTNDDGDDRNLKRNGDITGLVFDAAVLVDVYVYTFMMGRLMDITGDVGTYYLGVARTARVSEAVLGQQWNIRGHRSRHYHALHDRIQNERVPLDEHGRDVGVPRYSFIVWLAIKDRLSTGVRMRAWGIQQGRLCGRRINPDWSLTLQFVTRNTLSSLDKILVQMLFQTCIYYMWKERNDRRHQKGYHSTEQAIRIIDKAIRNRISSLRYKPDHKLAGLMQRWFEVFDNT